MYLNQRAYMESLRKHGAILDYAIVSEADGTITTEIKAQPPIPRIVLTEKSFAGYHPDIVFEAVGKPIRDSIDPPLTAVEVAQWAGTAAKLRRLLPKD